MKITRRQLRKMIKENLVKFNKSKFSDRFNDPGQRQKFNSNPRMRGPFRVGVVAFAKQYTAGKFGNPPDPFKAFEWLQGELYESLRSSKVSFPSKFQLSTNSAIPQQQEFNYLSYLENSYANDVNALISKYYPGANLRWRLDGEKKGFIQWTLKSHPKAGHRGPSSSKVYYTVVPKNKNFDPEAFTNEYIRVLKNVAFSLAGVLVSNSNIDRVSFKTWSSIQVLLEGTDDIVVYIDDYGEGEAVVNYLEAQFKGLNKQLNHVKILTKNERSSLGRSVIGTDYENRGGTEQSDTSMLSYVVLGALLNNARVVSVLDWMTRSLASDNKNYDHDDFMNDFNTKLGRQIKKIMIQWANMSSQEKVNAFQRAYSKFY